MSLKELYSMKLEGDLNDVKVTKEYFEMAIEASVVDKMFKVDVAKLEAFAKAVKVIKSIVKGEDVEKAEPVENLGKTKKREYTEEETKAYNERILRKAAKLQAEASHKEEETKTTVDNNNKES